MRSGAVARASALACGRLRQVTDLRNPDLPTLFVHFTGRVRGKEDPVPDGLPATPRERLVRILEEGRLLPSTRYTFRPAVCVSESTPLAVQRFFSTGVTHRGSYEPWALLLRRNPCIKAQFRPVIHASALEVAAIKFQAESDMRVEKMLGRMIEFDPPEKDWLHEREWRRPFPRHTHEDRLHVDLDGLVHSVIVPEQGWLPSLDRTYARSCQRLERIYWDGTNLKNDGWLELPVE